MKCFKIFDSKAKKRGKSSTELGEGGFGSVYRGSIKPPDGRFDPLVVAIKKLNQKYHAECFLQMKYRGVKTKEEKGQEQIEEQRVIEAKIRMRQQEIQDEDDIMIKRQEMSSSRRGNRTE